MNNIITGKAYVLSDNIDTDQIIPAEHLVYSLTDAQEAKKYGQFALSGVPVDKAGLPAGNIPFIAGKQYLSEYNIIIAGTNFGCGSSREHAPFALNKAGVKIIVAESYARIFYRNAIDGGFLIPLESNEKINDRIKTSDRLQINLQDYILKNESNGTSFRLRSPGEVLPIINAGGLFQYARTSGMIK
jgi:3-isopropylmalate/(R)-2-methylmalate dehydratase small subunit